MTEYFSDRVHDAICKTAADYKPVCIQNVSTDDYQKLFNITGDPLESFCASYFHYNELSQELTICRIKRAYLAWELDGSIRSRFKEAIEGMPVYSVSYVYVSPVHGVNVAPMVSNVAKKLGVKVSLQLVYAGEADNHGSQPPRYYRITKLPLSEVK